MYYKRALTEYWDKYRALIRQGIDEASASRIAHSHPVIYG